MKFLEELVKDVAEMTGMKTELQSVHKLQHEPETRLLCYKEGCDNIGMAISVKDLESMDYVAALNMVLNMVKNANPEFINIRKLSSYEDVKDKIVIELVKIQDGLEKYSHREIGDMAIVYRVVLKKDDNGQTGFLITENIRKTYGISEEQLYQDALISSPKVRAAESMPIGSPFGLPNLFGEVIATNADRLHGAAVIFYPGFLKEAAKKIGGSFFVLPSSIHEMIFVPIPDLIDWKEEIPNMIKMVKDVNTEAVQPEDFLADNAYVFDAEKNVLFSAEGKELFLA